MAQLELWVFLAQQEQERCAHMNAQPIRETIIDVAEAAKIIRRV